MRSTITLKSLAASIVAALIVASSLSAQESTTRGFTLGFHLTGASISVEGSDATGGGGGGLRVGYGVNRTVTLFFQADGIVFEAANNNPVIGTWTMGHGDLGVRFHFANSLRSWVPYLEASFTSRIVTVSDAVAGGQTQAADVEFSGPGFTGGGGIMFYFNQTLAFDIELAVTGGQFTDFESGGIRISNVFGFDATSARFNLGLAWWP